MPFIVQRKPYPRSVASAIAPKPPAAKKAPAQPKKAAAKKKAAKK
jgi:hypothetical protein